MAGGTSGDMIRPVEWLGDRVRIIDQTRLPGEISYLEFRDYRGMVEAIKTLRVRGAPAIGIAAAYGIALGALSIEKTNKSEFLSELDTIMADFAASRPTAVNLFHAIERMKEPAKKYDDVELLKQALADEAARFHLEEISATERLCRYGADLIEDGATILTHCNAGPLATAGHGTALGVIITAARQGKRVSVFVDETRPLLQGARLTAWELLQEQIPATLITDSMAGYFLKKGGISCVIVGADRIAANGDTANKIGTYSVAVLARENGVPFYVAAPVSTIDLSIATGDSIPIEERAAEEVTSFAGVPIAPPGVNAANPAFDITPHDYITAIITEEGIAYKQFHTALERLKRRNNAT
jgi:methylthioribose-1-phosphate isomerase